MGKIKKLAVLAFLCFSFAAGLNVHSPSAAVKFNVSNSTLKADIAKYSVGVQVNGSEQRFVIKASDIKTFKVRSKKQSKTKMVVKSVVYINREVATVKGSVTSTYKLKGTKWKLSSAVYTSTSIYAIHLKGTWSGTYRQASGLTRVEITIGDITADGFITDSVFAFSASPTNPSIPAGSYTLKGGADKTAGTVTLEGDTWIEQPEGYNFLNVYGYLDLAKKRIVYDTYNLSVTKN